MDKYPISWSLGISERSLDEKTRCCFWTYELSAKWKIKCVCEQNNRQKPAFIEIHRKSPSGEKIVSGKLEICAEGKQPLLKKKFICLLEDGYLFDRIDLEYPPDIPRSTKASLVIGEIIISGRTEDSVDLNELLRLPQMNYPSLRQLSCDMKELLSNQSSTADVNLMCGSATIPAHKSILSARSPVFEAMFTSPMKEATENNVCIEDVEPPILQAMLKYIYTGKTEKLSPSLATDLLFAANKYQIGCLESVCSEYLLSNMSMKNIASILLTGDFVSPDIKNSAIDFICRKCADFSILEKDKDWISLKSSKPALALEVLSAIIKYQERKLNKRA